MATVILLRHGRTSANASGILAGRTPGVHLDDLGRGQAERAADRLAVVPLADALTLPVCTLPPDVIVVPAFHGGLLGDGTVLPMVANFLEGQQVSGTPDMREAAEVITGAAAAWRMPDTRSVCPG